MYSIILVEDNSIQRENLKKIILSKYEFMNIYEADSESTALDIIKNNDINMFFIDIGLKESSGLDLAANIRKISKYELRPIIFLTVHIQYLTQAFKEIHCYDYILKPYNKSEVYNVLNKFISNKYNELNKYEEKEIVITLKNGIYVGININDILFVEVKDKDCEVNTVNGIYIAHNISLKKILKLIDCDYIIQSHRAFAINKNYICRIEKHDIRLNEVYFKEYDKTALLGYKFKDDLLSEFKKGKVMIC